MAESEQLPVSEARAGNAAAWDILFRRFQLPLYVYAFELVHEHQASLDIVQETFINAARHLAGLRDDSKFASWLFGIAHQKCIQRWRKHNREATALESYADEPAPGSEDPADILIREEQENEFLECIHRLPEAQRSVLLLHFLEDFSLEEIAAATGTQLGTVKSRMYYAKKALRQLLIEHEKTS